MRAVLQRVSRARVLVDGAVVGAIDRSGLLVLVGVTRQDGAEQVERLARKVAELRILREERSAVDAGAPVLVVSQFTLHADTRKGRRPGHRCVRTPAHCRMPRRPRRCDRPANDHRTMRPPDRHRPHSGTRRRRRPARRRLRWPRPWSSKPVKPTWPPR